MSVFLKASFVMIGIDYLGGQSYRRVAEKHNTDVSKKRILVAKHGLGRHRAEMTVCEWS